MTHAKTTAAITSTGKDDWQTPQPVLDDLDTEFCFSVDAAASGAPAVGEFHFGPGSSVLLDGLSEWPCMAADVGSVAFLNSPYSRAAGRGKGILAWHERAWMESQRGWTVVVLCPPNFARRWGSVYGRRADELRLYRQRLAFIDPATGQPVRGNTQDSCLVIYRPHVPHDGWPGGPRLSWIEVPR